MTTLSTQSEAYLEEAMQGSSSRHHAAAPLEAATQPPKSNAAAPLEAATLQAKSYAAQGAPLGKVPAAGHPAATKRERADVAGGEQSGGDPCKRLALSHASLLLHLHDESGPAAPQEPQGPHSPGPPRGFSEL